MIALTLFTNFSNDSFKSVLNLCAIKVLFNLPSTEDRLVLTMHLSSFANRLLLNPFSQMTKWLRSCINETVTNAMQLCHSSDC